MVKTNQRTEWIDIARGIGTILVIIGHDCLLPSKIWIYSFHMPLFFFLSGCTYHKYSSSKIAFRKIISSLVIPYLIFAIFKLIFDAFACKSDVLYHALGIVFDYRDSRMYIGYWFINCIILVKLGFILYEKINVKYQYILILYTAIALIYTKFINHILPWSLDVVPMASCLYILGILYMKRINHININPFIFIPFLLLNILISSKNYQVEMFSNFYGHFYLFYLAGILGIFSTVLFSKLLTKTSYFKNFLILLGQNSLYIYCLQSPLNNIFNQHISSMSFSISSPGVYIYLIIRCLIVLILSYIPIKLGKYLVRLINNNLLSPK